MKPTTREEITYLETLNLPMPHKFTGIWKGQHYWKGIRWYGPTNRLGQRKGIVGGDRIFRNAITQPETSV